MNGPFHSRPRSLPLSVVEHVDRVCSCFEAAWQTARSTGERPRIENYLSDMLELERPILLPELIALDIAYRRRAGENPRREDYQDQFMSFDCAQPLNLPSAVPRLLHPQSRPYRPPRHRASHALRPFRRRGWPFPAMRSSKSWDVAGWASSIEPGSWRSTASWL